LFDKSLKKLRNLSWIDVTVKGGFWAERQKINRQVTLPAEYRQCKKTGRIDSVKGLYKPGESDLDKLLDRANGAELGIYLPGGKIIPTSLAELENVKLQENAGRVLRPHHYWDSDNAKWIEAMAYSFKYERNPDMEKIIDEMIGGYEKIQQKDGYLNTFFIFVEPEKRWTDVTMMHELYCAGHLIEAAAAYYEGTGKRKFLDILCRYADHIDTVFGPEENKLHGYPGHQEIELALIKLYRITGNEKYLKLSKYFIDQRGTQPLFFDEEAKKTGRDPNRRFGKGFDTRDSLPAGPYAQKQAHLPVREQKSAQGHAVRMMYQLCGMADVAVETGDRELWEACETLWDNVTLKKMYITGGVGSESHGERFAFEYHLPNESAYNETCAAIGLVMWASRMLQGGADRKYADVMERALYNGVISGVSLEGDKFFYANHLASHPKVYEDRVERQTRMFPVRQSWFPVSCCPPNLARLIESVGAYACSKTEDSIYVHLYLESGISAELGGRKVQIEEHTAYPWDETVRFTVNPEGGELDFSLMLRIPEWCREPRLKAPGGSLSTGALERGYVRIKRTWRAGDEVELTLPMVPFLLEAHPLVREDCGKAAIQCGPFMYCLEEADNGANLFDITLDENTRLSPRFESGLFGGIRIVTGNAKRRRLKDWEQALYRPAGSVYEDCEIKAIPYYLWSNRSPGEMVLWIRYRQ
jgi:DUF1680 family protein